MPKINKITIHWDHDEDPDLSYLEPAPDNTNKKSLKHLAELRKKYETGELFHVGCWAEAEVIHNGQLQWLRSAGLWGIESDSPRSYCEEIAREELHQLKEQLNIYGVVTADFEEHIKDLKLYY